MNDTLFNFSDPIISSSLNILSESGLTSTYIQRGTGSLETPRVELACSIGAPVGHVHITSMTSSVFDAYEGTLTARVVTNRKENDSNHPTYVAKTMNVLSNPANYLNRMPYHNILRTKCNGVALSVNNDRTLDVSTMTFNFLCQIKPSAWS